MKTQANKQDNPLWLELKKRHLQGQDAGRDRVSDAYLTMAFLAGRQWCSYSRRSGLVEVEADVDEVRVTDNRMLPSFQRWMGYLFKDKPVITAFEGGQELLDAERARVASALCDYWESNCGWTQARREAAKWLAVTGVGFVAPVWREKRSAGKRKVQRKVVLEKPVRKDGELTYEGVETVEEWQADMAFECFPSVQTQTFPLNARSWDKVTGVLTADVATLDWINGAFGTGFTDLDGLERLNDTELNLSAVSSLQALSGSEFSVSSVDTERNDALYLILQWFERPTRERPNGRFVQAAGGRILVDTELPYVAEAREIDPQDVHNITMGIVPTFAGDFPGQMIPPAPFGLMREPQIRLNDLLTDERRNRKTVGRNKLIYEEGMLNEDSWSGRHGEKIAVRPGSTVVPQLIAGIPLVGLDAEIARVEASLEEVSGQTAALRGQNPTQVRSAFHLDILREEAMSLISTQIEGMERAFELQARLALAIARRRYDPEQVVEIYGRDYAGHALGFRGTNIRTDIRVKPGSMRPRNKAVREEKLKELLQIGAFNDPQKGGAPNMEMFWQMMEMGSFNRAMDVEQRHRLRAREENVRMLLYAEMIQPFAHEDHMLHVEEHIAGMARSDWYAAPDEEKGLFMAHIAEHRQYFTSQVAPEVLAPQDAAMPLGNPGRPPEPAEVPLRDPGGMPAGGAPGMGAGQQTGVVKP